LEGFWWEEGARAAIMRKAEKVGGWIAPTVSGKDGFETKVQWDGGRFHDGRKIGIDPAVLGQTKNMSGVVGR